MSLLRVSAAILLVSVVFGLSHAQAVEMEIRALAAATPAQDAIAQPFADEIGAALAHLAEETATRVTVDDRLDVSYLACPRKDKRESDRSGACLIGCARKPSRIDFALPVCGLSALD